MRQLNASFLALTATAAFPALYNRAGGIRTHGLHVPNVALYQAEPQPVEKKRRVDLPKGAVNL